MIQRKQSIYLLVAALLPFVMYKVPVAIFQSSGVLYEFFACHILNPNTNEAVINVLPLAVLPLLTALLSLIAIFKYKNRTLQMKIGRVNLLMLLTTIAVQIIYYFRIGTILSTEGQPGFSAIIPLVVMVLVFMANKAIKKDDNLVRSADRIR